MLNQVRIKMLPITTSYHCCQTLLLPVEFLVGILGTEYPVKAWKQ